MYKALYLPQANLPLNICTINSNKTNSLVGPPKVLLQNLFYKTNHYHQF